MSSTHNGDRRRSAIEPNRAAYPLRWEFFTSSFRNDGRCRWQWKILDGQRIVGVSDENYESFLECLDDAKRHGFDSEADIHLADPVTTTARR